MTLTTTIPEIDVSHVGILLKKEGRVYLLHASSTLQKVVVSTEPFAQFLTKSKRTTGGNDCTPFGLMWKLGNMKNMKMSQKHAQSRSF